MHVLHSAGLALVCAAVCAQAQDTPSTTKRISAYEAEKHFQEICVVTGTVAQVSIRPNIAYVNLEKPHPNSPLTGIIFASATNQFGAISELRGKAVELTGRIEDHQGQLQIVLNSTNQLKVLASTNALMRFSATEAAAHLGQVCVVTGKVAQVSARPNITYLNLEQPHPNSPLTGVIFTRATNLFGDLAGLQGKAVEFSGRIEDHRGQTQIILNTTNQLKVLLAD